MWFAAMASAPPKLRPRKFGVRTFTKFEVRHSLPRFAGAAGPGRWRLFFMTPLILVCLLLIPGRSDAKPTQLDHDSIPVWIRQIYEVKNDSEFLNSAVPVVTFYKRLSDSTSYCLYEVDDGVCHTTFVATQKNKKKFKRSKIGNECDEDFANPQYSSTSFEHDPIKRSIVVTTDVEKAKEKYLAEGVFKPGYDMENAETINYTLTKTISISLSGNLITKTKTAANIGG